MSIALGVHVGVDEISAVLVEADLPELGPVAARTVSIASVPGGVGDAATTMLGIMRVQAAQHDLFISRSAIVCDSLLLCGIVRAALTAHQVSDVAVLDAGDPRLDDELSLGTAAALIGIEAAPWTEGAGVATGDEGWSGSLGDRADTSRSARLTMIGLGVVVLAALSGATVWALAAIDPAENSVVGTADTSDVAAIPSGASGAAVPSSAPAIAGPVDAPGGPSTVPVVETGLFEAPVYGPVPVGTWSEAPSAGPLPTPIGEASGGGSVGGGGNSSSDNSNIGGGGPDSPTVDPKPKPKPDPKPDPKPNPEPDPKPKPKPETETEEPEPETEEPPTDSPTTTTEVPATTEPTSTLSEPAENPVE